MMIGRRAASPFRIGLISDTHGLLRPEAIAALRGADHIIHAGDIGKPFILEDLTRIAPLTAVRGNNDTGEWARDLPDTVSIELAGVHIHVLHDVKELGEYPPPANAQVIVAGHSHQPLMRSEAGILHVNPGSAGPRRFRLPVTVAWLEIGEGRLQAEIIHLL
jgi:putative phosphoesterase